MASPSPEAFWALLGESKLVDPARLDSLRRQFEGIPIPPKADAKTITDLLVGWLEKQQVLTRWQAEQVLLGKKGPFFLGDYRLLERLPTGRGGMIFRARHEPAEGPARLVSLAVLDAKLCQQPAVGADLKQRIKLTREANDNTLIGSLETKKVAGTMCIIAEDVPVVSLEEELTRRGPVPPDEAAGMLLPLAQAVAHLHRLGLVHGAISLDTVRRESPAAGQQDHSGRLRLMQFPLVADPHLVPPRLALETADAVARLGTRASCVAPEQLKKGQVCDTAGDVYALGCVFYTLLIGSPPGWQGDAQRTLSHLSSAGPATLEPAAAPPEVASLVSRCISRDPAERFPSAVEAAEAIAAYLGQPAGTQSLPAQRLFLTPGSGPVEPAAAPTHSAAVVINTASGKSTASPRKAGLGRWLPVALAILGLIGLLGAVALLVLRPAAPQRAPVPAPARETAPPAEPAETPAATNGQPAAAQMPKAGRPLAAPLWEPPGPQGKPPPLSFLPAGSQLVVLARPAEMLAQPEGRLFLTALGPQVATGLDRLIALAGCPLAEIALIQAAWQAGITEPILGGYCLHGLEPLPVAVDLETRQRAWGNVREVACDGETIHVGADIACWLPVAEGGRVLVAAPEEWLRSMVVAGTTALPRDWETLVGMLDANRHLTLLGSPDYLLRDGRAALIGPLAGLAEPLQKFLGPSLRALALSLQFGSSCYVEIDAIPASGAPAKIFADRLHAALESLPADAAAFTSRLPAEAAGQSLIVRLPEMLRVVASQMRAGVEQAGVVVNAYLPEHAAHNLALATLVTLAAAEQPGPSLQQAQPRALSLEARLARPISLVFARDTLETAVQMLADEVGVPIEILGSDLQQEGITKNQSFALDERDKPAESILRTILSRSNSAGKLVYIFSTREARETILITTRAAVARRGERLPAVFSDSPIPSASESP
jgi:serine/threonine-protein kinase